jgi:hypothetical protein
MLIYVLVAPPLYTRYVLKAGKAVSFAEDLPRRITKRISYAVDRLDPVIFHSQNLYELWGWSFIKGETDQSAYERFIVLQSGSQTYLFSIENKVRPDVQSTYTNLHLDLTNSGFSAYISKDVIKPGIYQIGILFKNRASGQIYYIVTHARTIRTANKLQLLSP